MATASATLSPATLAAATVGLSRSSQNQKSRVNYITGMNSFGGLKARNSVASLGLRASTEQYFAKIVSSLKSSSQGGGRRGGATCSTAGEIFSIAAIINGLVLVGVAVGFVLLRIEASVEEAE